jgi:RHS repeat-associated protein
MLQVNAGDKVTLEVFGRYTTSTAGNNTIINNLVAAVTGAFGIVNAGETQTAYQALNNNLPGTSALIPTTTNVPKAYLYYIIFNSSYVYQQFGYFSVPLEAALGHVPLKLEVNVPVNGFLYTYVANESNVSAATSVFFDDFTIIHEKNTYSLRVVESIDYDPFGVVLEGTHYVDISRPLNSYLYQGEFAEFEKLTGWSRFAGRGNYDAVLGRWYTNDPVAQFHSPFLAMGNLPTQLVDPDGRVVSPLLIGLGRHMLAGAILGGVNYFFRQMTLKQEVVPKTLFKEMARGAVVSGVGYGMGLLGLEIATSLAKNKITLSDGLINVAFQATATTLKSVVGNWAIGEDDVFSRLDIGVGDFFIPIRDGKFSWNIVDHIGNLGTIMTYTRGFIDVIQNKANIQFDRLTLSPRFIEKMDAFTGDRLNNVTGEMEDDETAHGYITKQGGGDSFNENGASFISYLDRNSRKTFLHESLHGVFNRIAGRGNSWFDSKIFGSYYLDHDKRYYESVIAPYVGRLFPR